MSPTTDERVALTRRPSGRTVTRQSWRHLLFLHWPVDPAALQALLPAGLEIDTFDGRAYIGLVPFTMRDVRPVWTPSVPWLSHFHECNVRTYVHQKGRNPGVWFFSLDAANAVAVWLARTLFGLPYFTADMRLDVEDERVHYATVRRAGGAACQVDWTIEGAPLPALPGTREHFLAERYLLYSLRGGALWRGRVWHRAYPLQPARVDALKESLVAAAGVAVHGLPPLVHYAAGVDVRVFGLERAN